MYLNIKTIEVGRASSVFVERFPYWYKNIYISHFNKNTPHFNELFIKKALIKLKQPVIYTNFKDLCVEY